MIDTSKQKWDFSKEEEFSIKWLNDNGFDGELEKQYVSKTIFSLEKDGVKSKFELPQGIVFKSISDYMEQFEKNWEILVRLEELRNETKGR